MLSREYITYAAPYTKTGHIYLDFCSSSDAVGSSTDKDLLLNIFLKKDLIFLSGIKQKM